MQPDLIGGRYRVLRAIGQGGMGTVWLARDETLHREVAVKQVGLLPGESTTDSVRALREARSTAALSHRNVVTVFDVVEGDDSIWLVMEHVPGRSLSEMIRDDGPLDPAVAASIGAQVAEGLAAAHAAGTMHRDVKPGNVLVREDGVAKISDFGIARTAGDPALTQSGFMTGTPSYFSPELARGADPGPASDVWALGATLYAAVEGRPAYPRRENPVAVLHDITTTQPPAPKQADALEPALLRMMDRDPQSRWSMDDAAHGLRRIAGRLGPPSTLAETLENRVGHDDGPDTAVTPVPAREPDPEPSYAAPPPSRASDARSPSEDRRRRRAVYAVLAVLALVAVLGGVAYAASLRQDDGNDTASGPSGSSSSPKASASRSPSKKASSTEPSQTSSSTPSPSASSGSASNASGASRPRAFLRDYFAAAPGGTDEGWSMLTPDYQARTGRSSYDGFWRTIRSVDVGKVTDAGGGAVLAQLTYTRTDGSSTTERHRLDLVKDGGRYLIDGDTPA